MKGYVYDIEVFPNFFCCAVESFTSNEKCYFEISERRNDFTEMHKFFNDIWVMGYNNMMYDNIIMNFIMSIILFFR